MGNICLFLQILEKLLSLISVKGHAELYVLAEAGQGLLWKSEAGCWILAAEIFLEKGESMKLPMCTPYSHFL